MNFIADLHIHSKYSMATSKNLDPQNLDLWARLKGINVVGTGDFTHPKWTAELKEQLVEAEPGFFALKEDLRLADQMPAPALERAMRFVLSVEISTIYKKGDKTRKVHHVILAPDFATVEKIQLQLGKLGNITSDGRPILGLDSRHLLEIALEANPEILFIPAHIWTPWFSALGDKSGFDSIEECYGDLSDHIYAIETGLSSDPPMNWRCSFLDKYTIVSNSDAHSPEKLGREANLFNTVLSYPALTAAIKSGNPETFLGTVEFFPEEGKYHHDGHRKCNISWNPKETLQHNGLCPVCGKRVTVGVMNRVEQLADREDGTERPERSPFTSLIPLKEVLSEILGVGPKTKKVRAHYNRLMQQCGSEFDVLLHHPLDRIESVAGDTLAEGVRRMRAADVHVTAGYDGEFGIIKVFNDRERQALNRQSVLFPGLNEPASKATRPSTTKKKTRAPSQENPPSAGKPIPTAVVDEGPLAGLNPDQYAAACHGHGPALILAGPGTGKTRVLTCRIAHLIEQELARPEDILAVTFTNKAAGEMAQRLVALLGAEKARRITVCTFHALGYRILKEQLDVDWTLIDRNDQERLLTQLGCDKRELKKQLSCITEAKQRLQAPQQSDETFGPLYWDYQNLLSEEGLLDMDDLIFRATRLLLDEPDVATLLRQHWAWVLVDEYQDVNYGQYEMIRALCPGPQANLYVIGDPNQAIYGFRGADVAYIQRFQEDWPAAQSYTLTVSYRCSDRILTASGQVVTTGGSLLQGLQSGVKLQMQEFPTDKSEAEFVARTIEDLIGGLRFFSIDSAVTAGDGHDQTRSLSDFAILCRTAAQIPALEKALHDHAVPTQVVGRENLTQQEPVRSVLDVLKLGLTPNKPTLRQRLTQRPSLASLDLSDVRFDPEAWAYDVLSGITERYFSQEKEDHAPLLQELLTQARQHGGAVKEFLPQIELATPVDRYEAQTEKVTLMTLHASKGLEFACVFIVGCEDGLLPYHLYDGQESDVAEERRLLYVGMTRAQHLLYLSWAKSRRLNSRPFELPPSPFLKTIEKELIEQSQAVIKKKPKKGDNQLWLFNDTH